MKNGESRAENEPSRDRKEAEEGKRQEARVGWAPPTTLLPVTVAFFSILNPPFRTAGLAASAPSSPVYASTVMSASAPLIDATATQSPLPSAIRWMKSPMSVTDTYLSSACLAPLM